MGKKAATADPDQTWVVILRRENPAIQAIHKELETRADLLRIEPSTYGEMSSYLAVQNLLPQMLSAKDQATVRKAQNALYELQGKMDRVMAIQLGARKLQRALGRLEILAKGALATAGYITEKTSKPSADQLIALAIPELAVYQNNWAHLIKVCQDVIDHLASAKDVLKLQMKMDENLHWARREGA